MAGSATLDSSVLVDGLLGAVDELRDLGRRFGVRPFSFHRVIRTWSGASIGEGSFTDVLTEITPRPIVHPFTETMGGKLEPCGLMEAGLVKLTEVSLTYTYGELTGTGLAANQEHLLLLREGYGQGQPDRWFRNDRPPFPDREEDFGWVMWLRVQQPAEVPTQIAELEGATLELTPGDLA